VLQIYGLAAKSIDQKVLCDLECVYVVD